MPSFSFLHAYERAELVAYVQTLVPAGAPAQPIIHQPIDTEPVTTPTQLAAGERIYKRLQCADCHGEGGRGNGSLATSLEDEKGRPTRARDLVRDPYKGGSSARDVYLRLSSGMDGTPMGAVRDEQATSAERWQLAQYVASLHQEQASSSEGELIVSKLAPKGVPSGKPLGSEWALAPSAQVATFPLSAAGGRPILAPHVKVRSLHDSEQIAFRIEWSDPTFDTNSDATESFSDGAAIQFYVGNGDAALGMGDRATPVGIWHWRADWQPELTLLRPVAVPVATDLIAVAANNPYVRPKRTTSVEEGDASGFGTFRPGRLQSVRGAATWQLGTWYVVFSRRFQGGALAADSSAKLAFAIWDGASGDRAGQKAISSWYQLRIDDE